MPRARDNAPPTSSRVPQFQQSSGAQSSGPIAALVSLQQEQAQSMQKLIATMEKAQIENQRTVEAAAQAGAGAATQVANQVASGLDRIQQEKSRQQDRAEDRAFAADQQRLNASLQRDAAKEAAAMGEAIKGQKDQMRRFRDSWISKRDEYQKSIVAYDVSTDELLAAGHFSTPAGRKQLIARRHHVDMMESLHQNHFDDRHLSAAYALHNEGIQSIVKGDDALDLSRLRIDPLQLPMAPVKPNGRRVAEPGEIDPDMMFELRMHGGYPKKGTIFNTDKNFGLPEGYEPQLYDADIVLEVSSRDDFLKVALDKSVRQEMTRGHAKVILGALDRVESLYDMHKNFNKMLNPMGGAAVQRSIENFLADTNPHKFDNMPQQLVFGTIKELFNGGRKGEEMAIKAAKLFDGTWEPKSDKELMIAMALESAMFTTKFHMNTEFMNAGEEGSFASVIAKQMEEVLGVEEAALAWGVPTNAVGFIKGVQVVQGRLAEASAFANRAHMGMKKVSILEQYGNDLAKYTKLADVYTMQVLNEGEEDERRVKELIGLSDALQSSSEAIEAIPPNELQGEFNRSSSTDLTSSTTGIDALIKLGQSLGPNTLEQIATGLTGGIVSLDTENLPAYLAQTKVARDASGYGRAAIERSGANLARSKRAKEARLKREAEGTPNVSESFAKGGAAGVVASEVEQLPALVGAAFDSITYGLSGFSAGMVTAVAGPEAGLNAARGSRIAFQGTQPLLFQGEAEQIKKNLDPAEIQQIINTSNEGR